LLFVAKHSSFFGFSVISLVVKLWAGTLGHRLKGFSLIELVSTFDLDILGIGRASAKAQKKFIECKRKSFASPALINAKLELFCALSRSSSIPQPFFGAMKLTNSDTLSMIFMFHLFQLKMNID
jgi:hypothetical protein